MNEVQVSLDKDGRIHLSRAGVSGGISGGICTLETTEALRAFFQAERDEELGRWRDTENTDMVAYRTPEEDDDDGRCILLLDENTGDKHWEWERIATSGPGLRYFAAHPEPKPRDAAQPDEVWVLTINNDREEVFRCGENGLYSLKTGNPLGSLLSCSHNKITAGRRIWPELNSSGAGQ